MQGEVVRKLWLLFLLTSKFYYCYVLLVRCLSISLLTILFTAILILHFINLIYLLKTLEFTFLFINLSTQATGLGIIIAPIMIIYNTYALLKELGVIGLIICLGLRTPAHSVLIFFMIHIYMISFQPILILLLYLLFSIRRFLILLFATFYLEISYCIFLCAVSLKLLLTQWQGILFHF